MCYNKESSITTYCTVIILSTILFFFGDRYDKYIAIFFFVAIQMQLAEYFMWTDQKCGIMNKYATILAYIILLLQPLTLLLAGYYLNTISIEKKCIFIFSLLLFVFWCIGLFYYIINNKNICSKSNIKGHLVWDFMEKINNIFYINLVLYFIFLLLPFFYIKNLEKKLFMIFMMIFSIINHSKIDTSWYSLWCYSVRNGIIYYMIYSFLLYVYTKIMH